MKSIKAVAALAVIIVMGHFSFAQVEVRDRGTSVEVRDRTSLRGLKGVGVEVLVEGDPSFQPVEIQRLQIKADVEYRLKRSGIEVLPEKEWRSDSPRLSVRVSAMRESVYDQSPEFTANVQVSLKQTVSRADNPSKTTEKTAWSVSSPVVDNRLHVRDVDVIQLRDVIGKKVDEFCIAYLSVNPKP
jgi:hypothetical protein